MYEVYNIFTDIGKMVCLFMIAYVLYLYTRYVNISIDKENRYGVFEELTLNQIADKKGFDLEKEILKRELRNKSKRSKNFRKQLEEEVFDEMFGSTYVEDNGEEEEKK